MVHVGDIRTCVRCEQVGALLGGCCVRLSSEPTLVALGCSLHAYECGSGPSSLVISEVACDVNWLVDCCALLGGDVLGA